MLRGNALHLVNIPELLPGCHCWWLWESIRLFIQPVRGVDDHQEDEEEDLFNHLPQNGNFQFIHRLQMEVKSCNLHVEK